MFVQSKDVTVEAYEELKNSRSHYSRNDQLFKVDAESTSLPAEDIEIFYCHVTRLLFASKRARPDIQACVAYIFTRMELTLNYYMNRHLDIDLLFVNKTQIFLILSLNGGFMYFKTLLSKHIKYIQKKLQQFIQSRRLKNIFTFVEGAFKNIVDWIHRNLHIDLINYMTDSQVCISNNIIQVMHDLMKQEVTLVGIQCYNIHHALILSGLFTNSDIYDNGSYASYTDWKIEKIPETNPKKLEFNIDKHETDPKKIDFNVNVNNDEIDDMNHKAAVDPNGGLADDNNNNTEDHGAQHK